MGKSTDPSDGHIRSVSLWPAPCSPGHGESAGDSGPQEFSLLVEPR